MRLRTAFHTAAGADPAFAYLSDFGRIEEWDPFIARAERPDPGPPRVGTRYDVYAKGPGFRLRYTIEAIDPVARTVRLVGTGSGYDGWDELHVEPDPAGGATVTYAAEIRLHGRARLLWLATPFMILFGSRAMAGMRRRLDALARSPATTD